MKRIIIVLFVIIFFGYSSQACEGKILIGKDTSRKYCISNATTNWWSAYQWCQTQGYMMPTPEQACDYIDSSGFYRTYKDQACPQLDGSFPNDGTRAWVYRVNADYTASYTHFVSWQKMGKTAMSSNNFARALCLMN